MRIFLVIQNGLGDISITHRQNGMSYGEIGERIYDRYGYTLDARDVRKIILGILRKKKEKRGT